jgi:hypothetical protein
LKAKSLLDGLEAKRSSLREAELKMIPNPRRPNEVRIEVMTARAELLQALATK